MVSHFELKHNNILISELGVKFLYIIYKYLMMLNYMVFIILFGQLYIVCFRARISST